MFRPMLAPREDPMSYPKYFEELRYPLMASPKLDGIRCIVKEGRCKSRTYKDLPSQQVQDLFSGLEHFDGELIVGDSWDFDVYNRTQSAVMSQDKVVDNLFYYVFDWTSATALDDPFEERLRIINYKIDSCDNPFVYAIGHKWIENYQELIEFENEMLFEGYEGLMLRNPKGRYKNGRGTWREGLIMKLKRYEDSEGQVIGFEEGRINLNPQERSELGYAKRSTSMMGMANANTLGKFIVLHEGKIEIEVGPGNFNHYERKVIWDNQEQYLGRILKYRHFLHGVKDLPRFPRATGWRDQIDI